MSENDQSADWGAMELLDENKLVCSGCGATVQLHMTTRHALFAQCGCTWARVKDVTDMQNHVWWPEEYVTDVQKGGDGR